MIPNKLLLLAFLSFLSINDTWAQSTLFPLRIEKAGVAPVILSMADLSKFPRIEQRVKGHDGKESVYSGVALTELLSRVAAPLGSQLRGKALSQYLLVQATDGYQVVFALPELDSAFTKQVIFLADRRDGQPLSGDQGPYQVIVPNEQKHARWIRQVTALKVLSAQD